MTSNKNLRQLFCSNKKPARPVVKIKFAHILGMIFLASIGLLSGILISQPIAKYYFRDLTPAGVNKKQVIIMEENKSYLSRATNIAD